MFGCNSCMQFLQAEKIFANNAKINFSLSSDYNFMY